MPKTRHETWSISALLAAAFTELQDDDSDRPCPATVELQDRGTREVLDAALTLCGSLDARWRSVAACILGQLGRPERTFPEECCDALIALLRDSEEDVLITALYGLGHLGNRRCDPHVLRFESHPEPAIRKGVAFSLAGTTLPEAVPVLLRLMDDPYVEARDWATTTLGAATLFDTPEIRAALLKRATQDDDAMTRGEALHGLARRGDRRAMPLLIAELSGDEANHFEDAARACLGVDDDETVPIEALLESLRAGRH
jgi:HEAT repeat protein